MNKKTIGFGLAALCYSIVIAGVFYLIGYKAAYDRMENVAAVSRSQTFYATISDLQDDTITVQGIEQNDVNFRGRFCFSVEEGTEITWRYTDISMEDLDIGDCISITFRGEILETDPGQIQQVEVIQLLEDER